MNSPEGLLRTPVELVPAATSFFGVMLVSLSPQTFHLEPIPIRLAVIAFLTVLGVYRTFQSLTIILYRIGICRSHRLSVRTERIPSIPHRLYLGRGFEWRPVHTQRLSELHQHPERARPFAATRWLWSLWTGHAKPCQDNQPNASGNNAIHGVGRKERDIWMETADRVGHTLVLGTTRVGKTRLAELIVTQDIRRGDTVIFFDPKGDVDLLQRMYSEAARCKRDHHFHFLHLGFPDLSSRYNPVGHYERITEVASRITAQLPDTGQSAAFRNFAWRYANIVARAFDALGIQPTFERMRRATENIDPLLVKYYLFWLKGNGPTGWKEDFLEYERRARNRRDTYVAIPREMKTRDPRAAALVMFVRDKLRLPGDSVIQAMEQVLRYDRSYFDKLIASLLPFLEKVTTGQLSSLLSPQTGSDDPRPLFSWTSVIREGGIVYVGLDTLADHEVGSAVGHAMFSDLKSVAASIYKSGFQPEAFPELAEERRRTICVHADEMNEIAGEEVTGMFNKAGGAGFHMTVYAQTKQDMTVRLKSTAAAEQQIGNLNSLIMLRVRNKDTAALLADQLPLTNTVDSHVDTSTTDGKGVFSSRSGDSLHVTRQSLVSASDLMSLPRGEAFALLDGGKLYKIRIPLIEIDGPKCTLAEMANGLRAKVRTP